MNFTDPKILHAERTGDNHIFNDAPEDDRPDMQTWLETLSPPPGYWHSGDTIGDDGYTVEYKHSTLPTIVLTVTAEELKKVRQE